MSINEENLAKWLEALRSDKYDQTNGVLARHTGESEGGPVLSYCCLGVGCAVAGLQPEPVPLEDTVYFEGCESLPPQEFHQWLGTRQEHGDDVALDWPVEYQGLRTKDNQQMSSSAMTCAGLNDSFGLTFPQIADMIDYFGIKETQDG